MKPRTSLEPISCRQLTLGFEPHKLDELSEKERAKAVLTLAQILMQAAGLVVEELGDDRR